VVIGQVKQLIKQENESVKTKDTLSARVSELEASHEREFGRAEALTTEYAKFRADHFAAVQQLSDQCMRAEQELAALPNYEYVKNVMIQYISTNDRQVHVKSIRALFECMKIGEEEQQKVKDAFNANNTSYIGSMIGSKLL
jgi:vacuolar-type H+-ATPase subunit I/STV1